jgi:hypothetical protein
MRFEYFRFLITPVQEPQLPLHEQMTREQLIEDIFSTDKHYRFKSGRASYGLAVQNRMDKMIQARIGRATTARLHLSPDKGFAEKVEEDWPGSYLLINLDDEKGSGKTRDYGQILAFEKNRTAISNSISCMRALADKINETIVSQGFFITINPIPTSKRHFWSVIDEYDGQIKKVVLTYTPPNLFNLQNSLEDDLRNANKNFNTTSTQVVLENETGHLKLPKDNALLKESAEYIDQGGGSFAVHLRDGKKKVVTSDTGVKTETFQGLELSIKGNNPEEVRTILETVLKTHDE